MPLLVLDCGNALISGISAKTPNNLHPKFCFWHTNTHKVIYLLYITLVLYLLHCLPISSHIQYKLFIMYFKANHGLAPVDVSELLHPYMEFCTFRHSVSRRLEVCHTRLSSMGGKIFSAMAPKLENALPYSLCDCASTVSFESPLKTYYTLYYYSFSAP